MLFKTQDDFDLEKIYKSGQCFRINKSENCTYRFITGDNVLHIKNIDKGIFEVDCSQNKWDEIWHNYFDLGRNYSKIRHDIYEDDIILSQMAQFGKGVRIVRQEPFEMLITFIISQRKSIPAIKKSVEALCKLCGDEINVNGEFIYKFPTAKQIAALTSEQLASCSLGYRVPYVAHAAKTVCENNNFLQNLETLTDEELLNGLLSIKGVGIKVANCIALFAYARVNCAPVDVWIQRVIDNDFKGVNPFVKYKINAGIYQQYMFYYAQLNK